MLLVVCILLFAGGLAFVEVFDCPFSIGSRVFRDVFCSQGIHIYIFKKLMALFMILTSMQLLKSRWVAFFVICPYFHSHASQNLHFVLVVVSVTIIFQT